MKIRQLHDKAMVCLQFAIVYSNNQKRSTEKYREAFFYESQAADMASSLPDCEPTRSILYRSAASLAFQAGDIDNAAEMITKCLNGNPSAKILLEIKELQDEINRVPLLT